jgi:hypothetical protein
MRKNALILFVLMLPFSLIYSANPFKSIVQESVIKAKSDSATTPKSYSAIVKDASTKKGIFITHFTKKNKLYFELPDSVFNHTYLLANRISSTSNTTDFVAGQMATSPLVIRFSRDSVNVYMHKVQTDSEVESGSSISSSFDKNFLNPIIKGFPIETTHRGNVVIDVTAFFGENERAISPIKPDNPIAKLLGGGSGLKGSFVSNASNLQEVKTFKQNIEIKTLMSFVVSPLNEPYSVVVNRSLVLLPDSPMKSRLQDNRVGYFSSDKNLYTTQADKIISYAIINRWRLEPKPEDRDAYFKGELVEPQRPIVFYVDSAFPAKWASAVKTGIEDWNKAFETAGFKNAVIARDYPKNNPDFDPDDMRYSCIKYATTRVANAMGPSYVDPRTGEILSANVIWYHNILSLLHHWRFTQTGAVDPRVRKPVFDDDVMWESLRYVASHEIGHTLGLMHNMGASYALPVDSLRSPSFTQKFGTTPSIMDYARNNFIAQPGDVERGVKLTPPVLGVYDIYAINWGYRLIQGAKTPQDEKPTLNAWIESKKSDPMYEFGAQQVFGLVDPTDQTEDLGNDHIKAGNLAISNLKILMKNLESWTCEPGENYESVETAYQEVLKQYMRHVRHVLPYIGGIEYKEVRQGEKMAAPAKIYMDKATQKKAMNWLVEQMRTYNAWLAPASLVSKIELNKEYTDKFQTSVIAGLYNPGALYRITESEKVNPVANYSLEDYMNDVFAAIFKPTIQNQTLKPDDISIQSAAIAQYIRNSGLATQSKSADVSTDYAFADLEPAIPCNHPEHNQLEEKTSFLRINFGLPTLNPVLLNTMMTAQLQKTLQLYKQKRSVTTDMKTRSYYDFQIVAIEKLFRK